jgi:hypothetical protein
MFNHRLNARIASCHVLIIFAVGVWTGTAAAQFDVPPPDGTDLICIEADPPVIVPDAAHLAAQLAAFEAPKGLSVKQSQRLVQVAQAFRAGREQLALQHWGAAVTDAVQTVGARNLGPRDIEDLMMIVLRQTLAQRTDALRLLVAQIEHVNAEKAELRDYANELRDQLADLQQCPDNCDVVTRGEVELELGQLQDKLDALGDISDELQRRLQLGLAPVDEAFVMLTNIFAKMSATADRIVASLK